MSFKKGDKVKGNWSAERIVDAVSPDGRWLWLVDSDGDYFTGDAADWTVIPPFFEEGEHYRRLSTGSIFRTEKVTEKGGWRAYLLRVDGSAGLLAYPGDFSNFEKLGELPEF